VHPAVPFLLLALAETGSRTNYSNGSVEGSRMLVELGANIHAMNSDDKTPLQLALDAGHHVTAELL
jgi:hypothetical protein